MKFISSGGCTRVSARESSKRTESWGMLLFAFITLGLVQRRRHARARTISIGGWGARSSANGRKARRRIWNWDWWSWIISEIWKKRWRCLNALADLIRALAWRGSFADLR